MACIVAGFPSNIAALQFEWAWHNAHLTRHIPADQRISFAKTLIKTSSRTGKTRKRPGRPSSSILDKLSNLHLLLRVPYFSRWPLEVRFFNEEVYRSWQSWCERVDDQIRPGIKIVLDLAQPQPSPTDEEFSSAQRPAKRRKIDLIGRGGVEGVDPTYARLQDVLEKSKFLLEDGDGQQCNVCSKDFDLQRDLIVICPNEGCRSLSHTACLSKQFLNGDQEGLLVPETGKCPTCRSVLDWSELMRELSLRERGEKEVRRLLSKKKKTKLATAAEMMDTESEDDVDDDVDAKIFSEEGSDDDDAMSVSSVDTVATMQSRVADHCKPDRLEIVIEDSDDDR